jgi:hypothetical protein
MCVDSNCILTRKKPWHWPKPDESTPVDAKVWCRYTKADGWRPRYSSKLGHAWDSGRTSWTAYDEETSWNYIVLANPDDLDEIPPMDLEV